jgi:hypothetical protein
MLVPERDWLILRGRLRAFASIAALPLVLGMAAASALETTDGVEVVQGSVALEGETTAARVAQLLERDHPNAAVLGMQDVVSAEDAEQVRRVLTTETGQRWSVRWFTKGEAIFWRPAVFALAADFGAKSAEGGRLAGVLLSKRDTARKLAVFTGSPTAEGALEAWIQEKTAKHGASARVILGARAQADGLVAEKIYLSA